MLVSIAYPAFEGQFGYFFPDLEVCGDAKRYLKSDLIIFSGGEDINPGMYGEQNRHSTWYSQKRDEIEWGVFKRTELHSSKTKVLGVCRGLQIVNVLKGGTLHQDLTFDIGMGHEYSHSVTHDLPSELDFIKNVNSLHHQGIKTLGRDLIVLSTYKGVPEIVVSKDNKILLVQFHPEFSSFQNQERFFNLVKEWVVKDKKLFDVELLGKVKSPNWDKFNLPKIPSRNNGESIADFTRRLRMEREHDLIAAQMRRDTNPDFSTTPERSFDITTSDTDGEEFFINNTDSNGDFV